MEAPRRETTTTSPSSPLHTCKALPQTLLNRVFALVYICGIFALLYHHCLTLLNSTTNTSSFIRLCLFFSDVILAYMWATTQAFRFRPIKRRAYPDNLVKVVDRKDYPGLDVFICTADPYKEPPMGVVNTALSVMAYDYPTEKISVYVSDDGGSKLTLFAFMEAAKFASHWLPYCREKNIVERCPEAYFRSNNSCCSSDTDKLKMMYENTKDKVEGVLERGFVSEEYIKSEHDREAMNIWTKEFTRHDHPPVIQVLLESGKDMDVTGHGMPNLVYISREKRKTSPHYFKAGALNVLLRVSATMTNAPLVLTLDCDMFSNDPHTPLQVLCYTMDPTMKSNLGYLQFPQRYHGINKNDIYGGELKRLFVIHPIGMDGLAGPNYVGTGCFFNRRAFFGAPSCFLTPEIPELNPQCVVDQSIRSDEVLAMAHHVARCDYEQGTNWGSKMGFRYGSLVEDYYTGYQLQCQGWKSVFCQPDRAAFLGDVPVTLHDALNQNKRWAVGLLEVAFSKYSPIIFGTKCMGLLMGLCYAHYAFWPMWCIPITIYGFIPPLALINQVPVFPEVTSPWFYLYMSLALGAYAQDLLDFTMEGGTIQQWWNDQRIWMIRGVSSYIYGSIEYLYKLLGVSASVFNVTSKAIDDEQSKRYEQGVFDFGVASPLFVTLTVTALINLMAFILGTAGAFKHGNSNEMFAQLFMTGFVTVNSWPIYQAMALRGDRGRLPTMTKLTSMFLACVLYMLASLVLRHPLRSKASK